MSNLVIVAIPEEQDRTWKISSEQVPHLTLLFLGDEANADTQQIVQFVDHAVTMSEHGQFYLDVERRGALGPDEADVLFFSKRSWNLKWIKQFRGQLLQNQAVRSAYDSTQQYEEWLPHLTLGYPLPGKPAEPLSSDDHPIYSVCFDRIAVWTTDFDGPEFQLEWPDRELEGPLAVAYSDTQKAAVVHDSLEHHGVKGMKWGVRRDRQGRDRFSPKGHSVKGDVAKSLLLPAGASVPADVRLAKRAAPKVKAAAKKAGPGLSRVAKDVYFETQWGKDTASRKIASEASTKWAEKDLPRLNAEFKGAKGGTVKGRLKNPLDKTTIAYRSRSRAAYRDRLNEAVAKHPGNASGTRRYEIEDGGKSNANYLWTVKAVDVKRSSGLDHAATTESFILEDFTVQPTFDNDGLIIGFKQVSTSAAQHDSLVKAGEEFIEHFGIKGMKWGVRNRKGEPTAVSATASSKVPQGNRRKTKIKAEGGQNHDAHPDALKVAEAKVKLKKSGAAALSNQELREVANRVQLENQVKVLTSRKGEQFVRSQFRNEGQNLAREGVRTGLKKGVKRAGVAAALA